MKKSEKSKLLERYKKACHSKDKDKQNQVLEKIKRSKAEDMDWLEFITISVSAYIFYLEMIGYPTATLLVELLKNTNDESIILDPLFEKAKENGESKAKLENLIKSDINLLQIVANNIWYYDFVDRMMDDAWKEIIPKLEQITGKLKKSLINHIIKADEAETIILSYESQELIKEMYLQLIIKNAKAGEYEEMWKHAQTAQSKLGLPIEDVYHKIEETSLKSNSLRTAERQKLQIAKRVIADKIEGKG